MFDEQNRERFVLNGEPTIPAAALAKGVHLKVPSLDYRGFRIRRFSEEEKARTNDFRFVDLNEIATAARYQAPADMPKESPADHVLFHLDFLFPKLRSLSRCFQRSE